MKTKSRDYVWIVEKKVSGVWLPHEDYDWFDRREVARRVSVRDSELRAKKYVRVEGSR